MKEYPWQTDTSIGKKSWSFVEDEENKTPEQIIHDLVDIVSKNGNLLLNIGPRADGTITEEQKQILFDIGEWLKVNGEGIYGARPWMIYGEGSTTGTSGSFTDNTATPYTSQDIRYTTNGSNLYVTCLAWTDGKTLCHSFADKSVNSLKIKDITMLGSNEKIAWNMTEQGLEIQFPQVKPCKYAYIFKIQI
jgi:alpha-L-fucosidase